MRNRLKPKEVNDALTDMQGRVLPVTTSASTGQMLGLTGENKTPAWVDNPLPAITGATTGQILKLTGENKTPSWEDEYSYTPPAYSETEVNTGQKWIDGKNIFCKVISFTTHNTSSALILGEISIDTLIETSTIVSTAGNQIDSFNCYSYYSGSNGYMYNIASSEGSQSKPAICIIRYTKPDPAPETRDDDTPEAPEEKKTTRKRTTK